MSSSSSSSTSSPDCLSILSSLDACPHGPIKSISSLVRSLLQQGGALERQFVERGVKASEAAGRFKREAKVARQDAALAEVELRKHLDEKTGERQAVEEELAVEQQKTRGFKQECGDLKQRIAKERSAIEDAATTMEDSRQRNKSLAEGRGLASLHAPRHTSSLPPPAHHRISASSPFTPHTSHPPLLTLHPPSLSPHPSPPRPLPSSPLPPSSSPPHLLLVPSPQSSAYLPWTSPLSPQKRSRGNRWVKGTWSRPVYCRVRVGGAYGACSSINVVCVRACVFVCVCVTV